MSYVEGDEMLATCLDDGTFMMLDFTSSDPPSLTETRYVANPKGGEIWQVTVMVFEDRCFKILCWDFPVKE